GYLYIEFKSDTLDAKEHTLLDSLHLNIRERIGYDAYRVSVTPESPNPIKCAVLLQKEGSVRVAEPEFITRPATRDDDFAQPSGRFIGSQWHHENTGGQIPIIDISNAVFGPAHFKPGADAKVKAAWNYLRSLGNRSLNIAVIDTGFALDHPQLRGDGTKIRNAFNAATRTSDVSPWFQASNGSWGVFDHGTSCAAVALGAWDIQGVLGAAPNSRFIPIKLDILSDDAIVKAFEHAQMNGADIISCSLGFPKPVPLSTWVFNTIRKVASEGRGGRGIPIFIAAGNANPASNNQPRLISDFATHPNVFCVTASNSLDEHSSYSFYGPNAFMCAPTNGNNGVGITTATVGVGSDGKSLALSYTSGFGGTSSATPLAAGVCALMLTANPNLTVSQIRTIFHQTNDRVGASYDANGHSDLMGYGRINALRAVQAALQLAGGGIVTTPSTTPSTSPIPTPTPTAQRGKVVSKFLNVRNGPSTSNTKVKELHLGDVVNLLSKTGAWWQIAAGQFVNADYIQVLPSGSTPAAVANSRPGKVISPTLNVRSGPSTANAKVAELKQGNTVSVFETSRDGWHRIGTNKWVLGKYIQLV
ncbi:MAG: S8 family serine peptidase, partial [Saprospiraceae bacterium]